MDDRDRLEALYRDHAAPVHAYLLRRTDPATADDALMEVFVVACRRPRDVPAEPLPWLLGCARRVLANQRRGAGRAAALADRIAVAGPPAVVPADSDQPVLEALSRLSEGDREILLRHAWEGLEPAELAVVLGCSGGTARVRLHRARRRLSALLPTPMEAIR